MKDLVIITELTFGFQMTLGKYRKKIDVDYYILNKWSKSDQYTLLLVCPGLSSGDSSYC